MNEEGRRGYFKFATKKQRYYSGPLIANEMISAALAEMLGFPVASLELATVVGPDRKRRNGIVSISEAANEVITWKEADKKVHQRAEDHVKDIELLSTLVVFDAWITNTDRATGKNLILYRDHEEDKYSWYLIDHGLALYGSPRKWRIRGDWKSSVWDKVWIFYHVPRGLLRLQSSFETLEPMIAKIESLPEAKIEEALNCVPKEYLTEKERRFIKRLLLYRQERLQKIIKRWLNYQGKKECLVS